MPTKGQMDLVAEQIQDVVSRNYVAGDDDMCSCWYQPERGGAVGCTVFRGVPVGTPEAFSDIPAKAKVELLTTYVSWQGFTVAQSDVIRRVLGGEQPGFWMGGIEAVMSTTNEHTIGIKPMTSEKESPLVRAERQLREWKAGNDGLSMQHEDGKLHVLEQDIDWTGVGDRDKQAVLAREVDFGKMTRDQLNAVYDDFRSGEVDERPARRLFDEANYANAVADAGQIPFEHQLEQVRPTTRNLVDSVMLDAWPRPAAIVDFGIDSQEHYEALYYPIRNGEVAPLVLDAAMGHGANLTELLGDAPSNPHKDVAFYTSWDVLLGRAPGVGSEPVVNPDCDFDRTVADFAMPDGPADSEGPER